jgi:hypothetical protein
MRARGDLQWYGYEDAIYRRLPGLVRARLDALRAAGLRPSWVPLAIDGAAGTAARERKRAAVACYASQRRAFARLRIPGYDDALAPETYWRLLP